ncbi:MAG: chemotaxis protein CheW [Magnetococcus sp. WYHC-3]
MEKNDPAQSAAHLFPTSAGARQVLERRAASLSQQRESAASPNLGEAFIRVQIGARERFGLPSRFVDEILYPHGLTPLPGAPAFIAGLVPRRGELLTVLNLAALFDLPAAPEGDLQREPRIVVLLHPPATPVGLLADRLETRDEYPPGSLAPAFPGRVDPRLLLGIYQGQIAMLDIPALLSSPRLTVDQ